MLKDIEINNKIPVSENGYPDISKIKRMCFVMKLLSLFTFGRKRKTYRQKYLHLKHFLVREEYIL